MTVGELIEILNGVPEDSTVCVIFDGKIDKTPSVNTDDDLVYIEGCGC